MTFDAGTSKAEAAVHDMDSSRRDGDRDPKLFANRSAGL